MSKEEMAAWVNLVAVLAIVAGVETGVIVGLLKKKHKSWKWLKEMALKWDLENKKDPEYNDETDNPYRLTIWECMF